MNFRIARILLGGAAGLCLLIAGSVQGQGYKLVPKGNTPFDAAYQQGLAYWRKPDGQNRFCAGCHTPDGIELAAYNFDDDTLIRRATPHLGKDGAEHIVAFIHAVRQKYGITKLLDPMKDRPMQPGGEVLPGVTAEERDDAFGRELVTALPTLATGSVDSLQDAEKAKQELLGLDARNLRVPILYNRLSEDGFHGKEHASFADWISDTTVGAHFSWEALFVLQDRYLQNPSTGNLLAIMSNTIFAPRRAAFLDYAEEMAGYKARALLIYQHMLRMEALNKQGFSGAGPVLLGNEVPGPEPNPFLDLGEFADARADTPFTAFQFPTEILDKKLGGPDQVEQMRRLRLPSLYAGWLMDQGLQKSYKCPEDRSARIITERLLSDGPYPMVDAFLVSKKMVTAGYVPSAWGDPGPQKFSIDYSEFLGHGNVKKFEPTDPKAREIYRRFVVNSFKMSLYLYKNQPGSSVDAETGEQIKEMRDYVADADPASLGVFDALEQTLLSHS